MGYNVNDGLGGTVAQTETVTILGPAANPAAANHAPTVEAPLHTEVTVGLSAVWDRLLVGASDQDPGNTLHVQDVTFSINGAAYSATVPSGITISNDQILVDPNNAAFAGLAAGQHETIVVHYNVSDGHGGLVAQTDTVTVNGPASAAAAVPVNHAPTVAEALNAAVTRGGSGQWVQLLAGASDVDATNVLHVSNLTFTVNGGAASATVPGGLTFSNDQILVDPNNAAFAALGSGQSETIVASYNVTDGQGGSVAQTDTITIYGQASDHATHDHAPTVAAPLASTVVVGAQPMWTSLLAGASDVDGDYLSVTNLTYSVNGGAFSSSTPAGVQAANGMIVVNQNDASFAGLAYGQSETITAHYNISDGRGGVVAQTDTITVEGHAPVGVAAVVNHAPTVDAPLGEIYTVGLQPVWDRLLAGASDADGNTLHATDLTYSINGGPASSNTPAGIQVANDMILLDPNNAAFAGLASGQTETIVVGYNVNDGHGGLTHQTDTLTVQGPLANPAAAANTAPTVAGPLSMTEMVGTQPIWARLLAGAVDTDADTLHATNLTYSVNGGAASASTPAGVQVANDIILVDPNNAAYASLLAGQHATIQVGFDITDGLGGTVHQTETVTIDGPAANAAAASNHAPTVAAALSATEMVGTQPGWANLLAGASDIDGNAIHVANVTFSVNGGAFSSNTPSGVQVVNDQIMVNQNDASFANLGAGQSDTIVASYNIVDGLGGSVAQTDTVTVNGPTNVHYMDVAGQALWSTGNSDVFVASLLDGTPTSASGNVDTIWNFNAAHGDRIDLSQLLSSAASVNSTISISQGGSDSSLLSVSVAGTEYYIAKVQGVDLTVPGAVADLGTLHGASWTDTIDVTSAHGGPATVTAGAHASLSGAVANSGGDWTIQVVSGTATEDAVHHTLVFSTPSSGNEVIIHTADGINHDLTNVTSVLWHG